MQRLMGLVYASKAESPFDEDALQLLVVRAGRQNRKYDVTGFLHYLNSFFTQYVEGHPRDVKNLLANLDRDSRHQVLCVVEQPDMSERRFPTWSMRPLHTMELHSICTESVLNDYLQFLGANQHPNEQAFKLVWKIVNSVAESAARESQN